MNMRVNNNCWFPPADIVCVPVLHVFVEVCS